MLNKDGIPKPPFMNKLPPIPSMAEMQAKYEK